MLDGRQKGKVLAAYILFEVAANPFKFATMPRKPAYAPEENCIEAILGNALHPLSSSELGDLLIKTFEKMNKEEMAEFRFFMDHGTFSRE